ncbi:hypothetical protein BU23DRAFT_119446 [Bimuria novae-zelandiae CBS 107.79]|uniref:Uncharacterized protein n=1 Tax=Bimuria novae-zelandiae CBS 107.79 TaxID=1447943 RepID=A0A6A5VCY5_9PLEO|nr:hypothetical protein BU23DRAFT_119446 [Bimuria novae-zelandiae CBS 107.79]
MRNQADMHTRAPTCRFRRVPPSPIARCTAESGQQSLQHTSHQFKSPFRSPSLQNSDGYSNTNSAWVLAAKA